MRTVAGAFGILCGVFLIAVAVRYGYKMSDNDFDGYVWGTIYGAVTFGGLFGHALAVRVWPHSRPTALFIFTVSGLATIVSLSNSLGAMAGRGNETQAKRMQVAETVRTLKRSLDRAEREREKLIYTPTNADAVKAAKAKADAATMTKEAECKKRGNLCREREADEARALETLETVTREKSVTDRAVTLDAEIAELKARIEKTGPVLDVNPQGSAFARLLNLPDAQAASLSTWQNFAMGVVVELLVIAWMVGFEVLGKAEKPKIAPQAARKPEDCPSLLETLPVSGEPQALPTPLKPRLIASRADPVGSVTAIMPHLMEPDNGKVEFAEALKAYVAECKLQGKRPLSPEDFGSALKRLCQSSGIKLRASGNCVYLLGVKIRQAESAESAGQL